MAESVVLATEPRADHGTRAARKLRKSGKIPAVIYGHKEATVAVALPAQSNTNACTVLGLVSLEFLDPMTF